MEKTPDGGWTAEDLDRIPGLPSHTRLLDGELVFRAPQTVFHMRAMRLLENHLLQAAPPELEVVLEMTVTLGKRDRPEPDVVLAVEVVSDDSEARDRETKPRKYAAAGIPHFWRVEAGEGEDGAASPVVYAFELEPATRTYAVTGIHHERLKTDVPFPVDIDLTAVARRV